MGYGDKKSGRDNDKLAAAVCSLAHAIDEASKARRCEFDWLRSHIELATKCDLKEMEKRLIDAIAKDATIAPPVAAAAIRLGSTIDQLDAAIPDKQTEIKT